MSHVMCHVTHDIRNIKKKFKKKKIKKWKLVGGGSVINGAYPVQFHRSQIKPANLTATILEQTRYNDETSRGECEKCYIRNFDTFNNCELTDLEVDIDRWFLFVIHAKNY